MNAGADAINRSALLVVDVPADFCAGDALPVPNSDRVVTSFNRYIDDAAARGVAIYASRGSKGARPGGSESDRARGCNSQR